MLVLMYFEQLNRYFMRMELEIAKNRKFVFSFLSIASLLFMWLNFNIGSPAIGVVLFVCYCLPNSIFVGRIFFNKYSMSFRLFFGFISFMTLLSLTSYITYFVYDFSNEASIFMLAIVSLVFSVYVKHIEINTPLQTEERTIRNHHIFPKIRVVFFLFLIALSFFFLYSARTGESLTTPWDVVSPYFFITYLLAGVILFDLIFRTSGHTKLILLFIIFFILIPACVYLLVLKHPAEHGVSLNIAWAELVDNFGRFVTNANEVERQSFWINKEFTYAGHYLLVVLISRILQVSVASVQLAITSIFFSVFVPVSVYMTVKWILPQKNIELALFVATMFGFSQHNIFLLTPPNKPETYALGLLVISIMFCVRYVMRDSSFVMPLIFLSATVLTHQYIGQYALVLLILTVYLKKTNLTYESLNLKKILGLLILLLFFVPSLIYVHELGRIAKYFNAPLQPTIDITKWVRLILPQIWDNVSLPLSEQLFYNYLNNFTYILYAVMAIGFVWAIRHKFDLKWIILNGTISSVALANMIVMKFFYPAQGYSGEWYRSFYAFSFLAFPLAGIGVYYLKIRFFGQKFNFFKNLKKTYYLQVNLFGHTISFSKSLRKISIKKLSSYVLLLLLLASALAFSVYGGFPRVDSMGPYGGNLRYPSDYDFEAIEFIESNALHYNHSYLLLGDASSTAAALLSLGYQVIPTNNGNVKPIYLFEWGVSMPASHSSLDKLDDAITQTNANIIYILVSYRFGSHLNSTLKYYSDLFGVPKFEINEKIYVFTYSVYKETNPLVIVDDHQISTSFWDVELLGRGKFDVVLSDDYFSHISENNSLKIEIVDGIYERFSLSHKYEEVQDWSSKSLFVTRLSGNNSGWTVNIVFRSPTISDYFVYSITDDFDGWQTLIVPLSSFISIGNPSWSDVSQILLQFTSGNQIVNLNLDRTVVDKLE